MEGLFVCQEQEKRRKDSARESLLEALERKILADAANPGPGDMDFPTSMMYTAATNIEHVQEQRQTDIEERRALRGRRREQREHSRMNRPVNDDDDDEGGDAEGEEAEEAAAMAAGLTDRLLDQASFPVMLTSEEFQPVPTAEREVPPSSPEGSPSPVLGATRGGGLSVSAGEEVEEAGENVNRDGPGSCWSPSRGDGGTLLGTPISGVLRALARE